MLCLTPSGLATAVISMAPPPINPSAHQKTQTDMWHGGAINFGCCPCELLLILHPKIGGHPITKFKNVAKANPAIIICNASQCILQKSLVFDIDAAKKEGTTCLGLSQTFGHQVVHLLACQDLVAQLNGSSKDGFPSPVLLSAGLTDIDLQTLFNFANSISVFPCHGGNYMDFHFRTRCLLIQLTGGVQTDRCIQYCKQKLVHNALREKASGYCNCMRNWYSVSELFFTSVSY